MSTQRISQITCDRCRQSQPLDSTGKPGRLVKPANWGRIQVAAKPDIDSKVGPIYTGDICPDCVTALANFLDPTEVTE